MCGGKNCGGGGAGCGKSTCASPCDVVDGTGVPYARDSKKRSIVPRLKDACGNWAKQGQGFVSELLTPAGQAYPASSPGPDRCATRIGLAAPAGTPQPQFDPATGVWMLPAAGDAGPTALRREGMSLIFTDGLGEETEVALPRAEARGMAVASTVLAYDTTSYPMGPLNLQALHPANADVAMQWTLTCRANAADDSTGDFFTTLQISYDEAGTWQDYDSRRTTFAGGVTANMSTLVGFGSEVRVSLPGQSAGIVYLRLKNNGEHLTLHSLSMLIEGVPTSIPAP